MANVCARYMGALGKEELAETINKFVETAPAYTAMCYAAAAIDSNLALRKTCGPELVELRQKIDHPHETCSVDYADMVGVINLLEMFAELGGEERFGNFKHRFRQVVNPTFWDRVGF